LKKSGGADKNRCPLLNHVPPDGHDAQQHGGGLQQQRIDP